MFKTLYETIGRLLLFFLFRRKVMFLAKEIFANQDCVQYYNTTQCSLVGFRKLCKSLFPKYFRKLKKSTGAFQKTYCLKKVILSDQETWESSLFLDRFKNPLFCTRSLLKIRYHPFNKVKE